MVQSEASYKSSKNQSYLYLYTKKSKKIYKFIISVRKICIRFYIRQGKKLPFSTVLWGMKRETREQNLSLQWS